VPGGIKGKAALVRLALDHGERETRTGLPISKVMRLNPARTSIPFAAGAGGRDIGSRFSTGSESVGGDDEEVFASVLPLSSVD
jgi:hypothetical protein